MLLKQAWDDSGEVYGYRKLHDDLCDMGEDISPNRAWRLARLAGIRAQIGYKKKPGSYGGSPAVVADNALNREFDVPSRGLQANHCRATDAPDQFWVTDITYIRTHEGFLYLAVVIDLFSRRVIGWSMQGRAYTDLPLQALLMAVWRRKPKTKVYVHSDQGSQFTSYEWQEFLEQHNLAPSMSRRANCWDNAVVESIRLDQAVFGAHLRSALTSAFAISIRFLITTTMATLAGFPAVRRRSYFVLRSGLQRLATNAGI